MRLLAPFLVLTLLLPSGAALGESDERSIDERFAEADWNDDGFVDRREYFEALVYAFFRLDGEGDGHLTQAELKGVDPEVFQAADSNGDGKIDLNEYIDARWDDFDAADESQDGLLTLDEVKRFDAKLPAGEQG
jgi:Ca2+-binding EF-hand superfamily protein